MFSYIEIPSELWSGVEPLRPSKGGKLVFESNKSSEIVQFLVKNSEISSELINIISILLKRSCDCVVGIGSVAETSTIQIFSQRFVNDDHEFVWTKGRYSEGVVFTSSSFDTRQVQVSAENGSADYYSASSGDFFGSVEVSEINFVDSTSLQLDLTDTDIATVVDSHRYSILDHLLENDGEHNANTILLRSIDSLSSDLKLDRHVSASFDGAVGVDHCEDFEFMDPLNWSTTEESRAELASALQYIGDRVESSFFEDSNLVFLYLSQGFGAEAKFYSEKIENKVKSQFARFAGEVLDGGDVNQTDLENLPSYEVFKDCDFLFVWRLLAGARFPDVDIENFRSNFIEYPTAVKSSLGARIASQFIVMEQFDAAYFVLSQVSGGSEVGTGEHSIVEGQLLLATGDSSSAGDVFAEAARVGNDFSVDALGQLAGLDDYSIPSNIKSFAEDALNVYSHVYQDTERWDDIESSQVLFFLKSGKFKDAISRIENLETLGVDVDMLVDEYARNLIALKSDGEFALHALRIPPSLVRNIDVDLFSQVLNRLKDLEFFEAASRLNSLSARPAVTVPSVAMSSDLGLSADATQDALQSPSFIENVSGTGDSNSNESGSLRSIESQISFSEDILEDVERLSAQVESILN